MNWRSRSRQAGLIMVLLIGLGVWIVYGTRHHPTYPPPDARSPGAARRTVEQLVASDTVTRSDLAVPLAPSTLATPETAPLPRAWNGLFALLGPLL